MATHRNTWKRRERDAASLFGARRQVCSGSSGRDDRSRSDSTHERIYLETKLKASNAVRTLWEDVAAKAKAEGKTPVLALFDKNKVGGLFVVHETHLREVLGELLAASTEASAEG